MTAKDNRFNVIHLSDTHIRSSNIDELIQFKDALVVDIKKLLSKDELKSSLICFTGDLISRGDYGYNVENQFSLAIDNLIYPLLLELEMEPDSFFIVPGNHEIDLSKVNSIYDSGLREELKNYNGELSIDYKKEETLRARLDDYRKFEIEVKKTCSDDIVNIDNIVINDQKIGVCLLNTSWNLASDSQNDKGKVIIGANLLKAGLQKIKKSDYKICLMHHSISWLRDEDAACVEPLLGEFDLVLYGHSHYASQKQVISPNGKSIYCMASEALPLSAKSGYNIIRFDGNNCTVMQRLYYVQRNEFDADLNIYEGQQIFTIGQADDKTLVFNACVHTKKVFSII